MGPNPATGWTSRSCSPRWWRFTAVFRLARPDTGRVFLSPDNGHVTAIDWLTLEEQDWDGPRKLLDLTGGSIDEAGHPGWVSSLLHAAHTRAGVANFTQWRTAADLSAYYDSVAHYDELLRAGRPGHRQPDAGRRAGVGAARSGRRRRREHHTHPRRLDADRDPAGAPED
ncbi:hypothetical protein GCM10023323_44480 [Streptomyces thinghirensis]|uniref:Uncharacterized protein n=1 Tax=Streptomyces thinghirensis TaxID=551547 RepID=A0ABP9T9S7_9ACTN